MLAKLKYFTEVEMVEAEPSLCADHKHCGEGCAYCDTAKYRCEYYFEKLKVKKGYMKACKQCIKENK